MRKRVCYIHIGPHKTGTSSIQGFLKENRAELLRYGYFVPPKRRPITVRHQRNRHGSSADRSCQTSPTVGGPQNFEPERSMGLRPKR